MIRETLLRVLFPRRCPVCDKPLRRGETICPGCEPARLSFTGGARCPVCGLRVRDCGCGDRLFYDKVCFPFYYEGGVRQTLQKLKFGGRTDLAEVYADEMLRAAAQRGLLEGADAVCWIPMRPKAERRRGYNQARLLAEAIGKKTGLPVVPYLYKAEDTAPQHDLRLSRRRGNILGVFEPVPDTETEIAGRTVLLTDDILTSGNTLNEAAKTLLIFGAERVVCLCAAGAKKKEKTNSDARKTGR